MYKKDLKINNLQWLICHKTKPGLLPYERNSSISTFIIIKACWQHGFPWLSLAICSNQPLLWVSPLGCIYVYIHTHTHIYIYISSSSSRAAVLVVLLLLGHMWGSIVVRHLRARLCFSSSVRHVWLVWPV